MKASEYDLKVIKAVKALRGLRGMKQQEVADALCIERSGYTKIENGEGSLSLGQLKQVSCLFKISVFQILAIAEADEIINFKLTSLSDILINFLEWIKDNNQEIRFTEEELYFLITKIKNSYTKESNEQSFLNNSLKTA